MSAETVASTIHPFLGPEVLVTACAILVGGLLAHRGPPPYGGIAKAGYTATNDRLTAPSNELLYLLPQANAGTTTADAFIPERANEIDNQIPDLLHRHEPERDVLLSVCRAVLTSLVAMFVIAVAAAANSAAVATIAPILLLASAGILSWGVLPAAVDVRQSRRAVEHEVRGVASLRGERT